MKLALLQLKGYIQKDLRADHTDGVTSVLEKPETSAIASSKDSQEITG